MSKNVKKNFQKFNVFVSDNLDQKYRVAEKAIPSNLPTSFKGKTLTWMHNFGFFHKANNANAGARLEEEYDVELERAGSILVYFDGSQVQELTTRPSDTDPNRVKASLDLGDPPMGWGLP